MKTQNERLLAYLKKGKTINPLESWVELGIYRLSDTIFRLRNEGFNIETEKLTVKNKFGENCTVANYKLN